jgi:hypothetical protein
MLAKQSWRLVTKPDSLYAQVLKAKYYTNCDILKAGPKKGASFTWQRIMAGLRTFKRGCIWKVGTGEKINIWLDPWVPLSHDRMVQTQRGQIRLRTIDELINPDTMQWDEQMFTDNVNPIDVSRILRIPLSENVDEDFVA